MILRGFYVKGLTLNKSHNIILHVFQPVLIIFREVQVAVEDPFTNTRSQFERCGDITPVYIGREEKVLETV